MSVYKFYDGKIEPLEKITGAEIIEEENADAADTLERLKNNPAEDPFAATDAAETAKAETETKRGDSETKQAKDETKRGDSETGTAEAASVDDLYVKKNGRYGSPKPQSKTDWVEEAYKCFIKDAGDIDPTDPVASIEAYFQKNATDELKARCKAEGKDAKGCWKFIEAVARKALHGSAGHIDPGVVYAIAMHWFEDVPKDWDKATKADTAKPKKPTTRKERLEERVSHGSRKAKAELRELKKKERAKAKAAKAKRKPKQSQGFFFEMLETPATTPEKESEVQG